MRNCLFLLLFLATASPGQTPTVARKAKPWTPPKTPWGDPDLQGVWPGTDLVGTPLQRDPSLGTRAVLTDQEFAQRVERSKKQSDIDSQETVNEVTRCDPKRGGLGNTQTTCSNGVSIGPPLYWDDRGKPNRQASLVVDPPDGRIPPLTPEAQKSAAATIPGKTRVCGTAASRVGCWAPFCLPPTTTGIKSSKPPAWWRCATR